MWKIVLLVSLIAVCTCKPEERVTSFSSSVFSWYPDFFQAKYLKWTQMEAWLVKRSKSPNCKNICKLVSIGKSYQNRKLYVMKIHAPGSSAANKPSIWIDAGIHAREWISPATALYLIRRFVNGYKTDSAIKSLLNKYHVYIMPCINPDGYVYSWTTDRLWRKNRKPSGNGCIGSDINRNFNHQWNKIGTSSDPCDYEIYPGSSAESEPETKAVATFVTKLHKLYGGVTLFLTLHGYGQIFVSPWGYTTVKPSDYDELTTQSSNGLATVITEVLSGYLQRKMCIAKIAADKIETVYGTKYTYGDSKSTIGYSNSGTSKDWAYGKLRIPYVFTVELRGPPGTGYQLPESQIKPNGRETWEGFMAMIAGIDTYACLPRVIDPDQWPPITRLVVTPRWPPIPRLVVTARPIPGPGPLINPWVGRRRVG